MTTYAVSVHRNMEYASDDIAFAIVDLTTDQASAILRYKPILAQLTAENSRVAHLAIYDYTPEWVSYGADEGHFRDEDGKEIEDGIHMALGQYQWMPIAEIDLASVTDSYLESTTYCTMYVSKEGIYWEGQEKHMEYSLSTTELPWSAIEAIVTGSTREEA